MYDTQIKVNMWYACVKCVCMCSECFVSEDFILCVCGQRWNLGTCKDV